MAKYSFDFKRRIVLEYLQEKNGYGFLATKYHIPSESRIREWVAAYRLKGEDGLKRSRENKNYSFQFKLNVVQVILECRDILQEVGSFSWYEVIFRPCPMGQPLPCRWSRWSQISSERKVSQSGKEDKA